MVTCCDLYLFGGNRRDYKEKYEKLVNKIKDVSHWAWTTNKTLAGNNALNGESENFLKGVSFVTLDLTKLIKEQEES